MLGSACDAANDVAAMVAKWDLGNYYVVGGSGRVIPPNVTTVFAGLVAGSAAAGVTEIFASLSDDLAEAEVFARLKSRAWGLAVALARRFPFFFLLFLLLLLLLLLLGGGREQPGVENKHGR